jgi:hypothetical protein
MEFHYICDIFLNFMSYLIMDMCTSGFKRVGAPQRLGHIFDDVIEVFRVLGAGRYPRDPRLVMLLR